MGVGNGGWLLVLLTAALTVGCVTEPAAENTRCVVEHLVTAHPFEGMEDIQRLEAIAKVRPDCLLRYLRDDRKTKVLATGGLARIDRLEPYRVWEVVDQVLGRTRVVPSHDSMESAWDYWQDHLK